jgi:hypothetical protein
MNIIEINMLKGIDATAGILDAISLVDMVDMVDQSPRVMELPEPMV